jgi:hypothetical protein
MFCSINRVLYAVLLLFSVVALFAWVMPHNVLDLTEIQSVKVATLSIPNSPDSDRINDPGRNVFDKDGNAWQKPRGIKEAEGNTATTVLGIVRLRGLDGVLTLQGFVPIGKTINGGKLVAVEQGKYVLDFEGQRKEFAVDDNRERRRKRFESLGLPFLN